MFEKLGRQRSRGAPAVRSKSSSEIRWSWHRTMVLVTAHRRKKIDSHLEAKHRALSVRMTGDKLREERGFHILVPLRITTRCWDSKKKRKWEWNVAWFPH